MEREIRKPPVPAARPCQSAIDASIMAEMTSKHLHGPCLIAGLEDISSWGSPRAKISHDGVQAVHAHVPPERGHSCGALGTVMPL